MEAFIPNDIKKITPRDPPWITNHIRASLNKKNRLYTNFKRHRFKTDDKDRLGAFRTECHKAVEMAKLSYMSNLGNILDNLNTPQKSYWKLINRVMNISRAPIVNSSVLPVLNFHTEK